MRKFGGIAFMVSVALTALLFFGGGRGTALASNEQDSGRLTIVGKEGEPKGLCPLKGTRADAVVSGFGARVTVVQTFVNPSAEPIEAVYTFPLPENAAVDRMRMKIGSRVIEGEIKRREEARRVYEAAKAAGQSAALLDQERPNIFTQSVANILPRAEVQIEISYVQTVKYERGQFEFVFPMVVGPRFLGNAKDPDKIAPPITPEGTRTGSNIDLQVTLDAGAPIQAMESVLHEALIERGGRQARVRLAKRTEIPNRDFILRYTVASESVQPAVVSHYDARRGGFFSVALLPPKAPRAAQIANREMVFVMDQSGSQNGFPIDKSKELTLKVFETMRPGDTFNVFGFNNTVRALWPESRPNTAENLNEARAFVQGMRANGGTQLLEGLKAAVANPRDPTRLRIVVFNTDGFVGDENEILQTISHTRDDTRIFTFGIGNSVNRYLIEGMSREGRGACEIVTLAESADRAVERFLARTRSPILTDVEVEVEGVKVSDLTPSAIPDVFSETPIVFHGRYGSPGNAVINIRGRLGGEPWSHAVPIKLSGSPDAPACMSLWARSQVDTLMSGINAQRFGWNPDEKLEEKVTDLALEYGLMTEFTSFVAVEPRVVNIGGKQRTVRVPVEMADGVSYEGIFGIQFERTANRAVGAAPASIPGRTGGFGGGGIQIKAADAAKTPALRARTFETVVDPRLHRASGRVEVQVWLREWTDEILDTLRKEGLKIEHTDKGLKIVFGECDAKVLRKLAEIEAVSRIKPVE